ncbi:MAG: ATP-binding cassette domain-containing protein [Erysipelotrichaceae bacterium]|nr:ATP-binding cassette domain-containing protein [Erysipelotrichaceae bacterium]
MPDIRFSHVSVYYEDSSRSLAAALSDATFFLEEGKIHALIGESGSGKSTVINVIAGRCDYEGNVLLSNRDLRNIPLGERGISYVDQNTTLYPNFTVYENIAFPLKAKHIPYEQYDSIVKEVAAAFHITPLLTRKPSYISLGQASRVCLARAFAKNGSLFLLDEPFAHLDEASKEESMAIFSHVIREKKGTALFVTHSKKEALSASDDLLVLEGGRVYGPYDKDDFLSSSDARLLAWKRAWREAEP